MLVAAPDRLARHYAYQVVVVEELQRSGCEVVFLNHPFGKTPEEQMLVQVQGVFAEYERALINERTRPRPPVCCEASPRELGQSALRLCLPC